MDVPGYRYVEFELDSYDTKSSFQGDKVPSTDWPLFDLSRPLGNITYIKILEAQIPFTWYVFNNKNNSFILQEPGATLNVTIPVGNYNASTLATAWANAMTAASTATDAGHFTYTVTYSALTQKFTVSTTNAPSVTNVTFSIIFPTVNGIEGNTDPSIMMGGNATQTSTPFIKGPPDIYWVLEMPNAALVTGPNYLYLNSQKIGSLTNTYLPEGAENFGSLGPQITKIPVNTQAGGVIFWSDPAPQRWFRVDFNSNVPQLDFYLTLGNWNNQVPLSLNGCSFSIKLGMLIEERTESTNLSGQIQDGYVVAREGPKRRRAG